MTSPRRVAYVPAPARKLSHLITPRSFAEQHGISIDRARLMLKRLDEKSGGKLLMRVRSGGRARFRFYTTIEKLRQFDAELVESREIAVDAQESLGISVRELRDELRATKAALRELRAQVAELVGQQNHAGRNPTI